LPFLDYRLVEYSFSLPSNVKIHNAENKYLLRRTFSKYITKQIISRKDKMGFVSPQEVWQKTLLKNIMKDFLLSPEKSGLLNQKEVEKMTKHYFQSESNLYGWKLWRVFCFKYWYSIMFT
jgi:asparagine synthase (glutamine-hydrolysing)